MSAPIRVVYVPHVQELIGQVQRDSDEIPYVPKSDYDELQAKLTESQRLNKVALEAMKMDAGAWVKSIEAKRNAINNAIKEIEKGTA